MDILDMLIDDAERERGALIGFGVQVSLVGSDFSYLTLVRVYENSIEVVTDGHRPVTATILRRDAARRGWTEGQILRPADAPAWLEKVRDAARPGVEAVREDVRANQPARWGAWRAAQDRESAARQAARDRFKED